MDKFEMSAPLFQGIYYHIQSRDIEPDLLEAFRTNLDLNGAVSCEDPCESLCQLILVDTPTGEIKFICKAHGKLDTFQELKESGDWDFDTLCTHFSRRGTGVPDVHKDRRKKVVGVGWIVECLSEEKLLVDNRYALWEVIAEDRKPREIYAGLSLAPALDAPSTVPRQENQVPLRDHHVHQIEQQSLELDHANSTEPLDPNASKAVRPTSEGKNTTPTLFTSTPMPIDWAKMPPSPPLTAASSMSTAGMWATPKLFDVFSMDRISPRTFYVACQNSREVELAITADGGTLDSQSDATFIIVDAAQLGDALPHATLELLGNLRRSQKPVSPRWIDGCVQRGTILDLEQFLIRAPTTTLSTVSTVERRTGERPTNIEVPQKKAEKVTDIEGPYKQASTSKGDTTTFERKRRLSQSEVQLADDVVRPTGIIRTAVDPRVRPRPSAEIHSSIPETLTIPATSAAQAVPATQSPDTFGKRRQLSLFSVYDRPEATTLAPSLTPTAPSATGDDHHKVVNCPDQVPSRGVNVNSHTVRAIKPSLPNAAETKVPSPLLTKACRPDTPPLPPNLSTSSAELPSHDKARVSVVTPDTSARSTGSSRLPKSSAKVESDPHWQERLALAIHPNRSTVDTTPSQTSAHDDHIHQTSSTSSSEVSDDMPSCPNDESTAANRIGDSRASPGSCGVPRSMMVTSARSHTSDEKGYATRGRATASVGPVRLGELVDELDEWLKVGPVEPTKTNFLFLKALDLKKPGYRWKNLYYRKRRTVRGLLLARGHDAAKLDQYHFYDVPDATETYDAAVRRSRYLAACPPSLSSAGSISSSHVCTNDRDGVDRNGRYHPQIAQSERRLKKLITHLDVWLKTGFQDTRIAAISRLQAEAPEIGWHGLFRRKGATIRTRLLAMGWREVDLDEAGIVGKPDRVGGPQKAPGKDSTSS